MKYLDYGGLTDGKVDVISKLMTNLLISTVSEINVYMRLGIKVLYMQLVIIKIL